MRLRGIGELLTVLPFEFGFDPSDSLVVALIGDGLKATLRLGYREAAREEVASLAAAICEAARRCHADAVIIVDYRPRHPSSLPEAVVGGCTRLGMRVDHVVHVRGDSYFISQCGRGCCDERAYRIPAPREVPAAADFVLAGIAPAASRQAAVSALRESDPGRIAQVTAAMESLCWDPGLAMEEWEHLCALPPQRAVEPDMLAAVVLALHDTWLRDELIATLVPELMGPLGASGRPIDRSQARSVAERLRACLAGVPEESMAVFLVLVALARWRSGDTTGAHLAATEAIKADPGLSLAGLVMQLLTAHVSYDDFVSRTEGPRAPEPGDDNAPRPRTSGRFERGRRSRDSFEGGADAQAG